MENDVSFELQLLLIAHWKELTEAGVTRGEKVDSQNCQICAKRSIKNVH